MTVSEAALMEVKVTKINTVLKLISKFWAGRLEREALAARLPPELWSNISEATDCEAMLRAAKTFQNRAKKELRVEKSEGKAARKQASDAVVFSKYTGEHVEEPPEAPTLPWLDMPLALIPEYNCITTRRFFRDRNWAALAGDLKKLKEKRRQIDHIVGAVQRELQGDGDRKVRRIVDFAGGRGDLGMALAWMLGDRVEEVVVVEYQPFLAAQGRVRAEQAGLPVRFVTGDLRDFDEEFDLAIACHACGSLIDEVLELCLQRQARFLLLTCCFGKILKAPSTVRPLSFPRAGGAFLEKDDFEYLCKRSDAAEETVSSQAMHLINSDRIQYLRSRGARGSLEAIPRRVTNKNLIIKGSCLCCS